MTKLPDNFWSKTTTTDCVIWKGAVNSKGYPCFAVDGKSQLAHRLAWVDARGAIPEGLTVDHTCRVRNCVNVEHLELVTNAENTRRRFGAHGGLNVGGACLNGHSIRDEHDVYTNKNGRRECHECRRQRGKRAQGQRVRAVGTNPAIRTWAQAAGLPVGVRGRISADIRAAYFESIGHAA